VNISKLGYALLTLLARGEFSGYDLARQMSEPIGFFWTARHSQIYPELAKMEEQGLLVVQRVEQHDRPDKKLYSITETGREALRQWVTEPIGPPVERSELVLKAYAIWQADPEQALRLFREQEAYHAAKLAQYEKEWFELKANTSAGLRVDDPCFADYITLWRGVDFERGYVEWCHWIAEQFERHLQEKKQKDEKDEKV